MGGIVETVFWFLVVLTPIVFVHELGHSWVARRCGVRVEVFSVGFGRELVGWTDRAGTRWKISLLPFGGYVRMFGQSDTGADDRVEELSEADRRVSFVGKSLAARAAIVAAGPLANLLFAILVFAVLFGAVGQPFTPAIVTEVAPDSPAAAAGLQPGDRFVSVAGSSVARFEEVQRIVRLHPGLPIDVIVERDGSEVSLSTVPRAVREPDGMGGEQSVGVLGVRGTVRDFVRHAPHEALWQAVRETGRLIGLTVTAVGQMVSGDRGTDELGGPVRIAQMSGTAADAGIATLIVFAAFLSINLGLINLLPVPMLDGGHLMFYAWEAVAGRPPGERWQDIGVKIGLALVLALMVFATVNDLVRLPAVRQLVGLIG